MTGARFVVPDDGVLEVAALLARFPVALLTAGTDRAAGGRAPAAGYNRPARRSTSRRRSAGAAPS
jgi:hypothetical protein